MWLLSNIHADTYHITYRHSCQYSFSHKKHNLQHHHIVITVHHHTILTEAVKILKNTKACDWTWLKLLNLLKSESLHKTKQVKPTAGSYYA